MQRLTLILSAVAISTQMQFRPQLFTFMMIGVVMMVLAIEVYRGAATLWPLIPMFALWANFHGGYIVGLGAMGIAAAVLLVQGLRDGCRMTSAWRLGLVTLGCAAATIHQSLRSGLMDGRGAFGRRPADSPDNQRLGAAAEADAVAVANSPKPQLLQDVTPLLLFAGFVAAVAIAPDLGDAALVAVATIFIGSRLLCRAQRRARGDRAGDSAGPPRKPGTGIECPLSQCPFLVFQCTPLVIQCPLLVQERLEGPCVAPALSSGTRRD